MSWFCITESVTGWTVCRFEKNMNLKVAFETGSGNAILGVTVTTLTNYIGKERSRSDVAVLSGKRRIERLLGMPRFLFRPESSRPDILPILGNPNARNYDRSIQSAV